MKSRTGATVVACVFFSLWLAGVRSAHADQMVIDLRPQSPVLTQQNDGGNPGAGLIPPASYRARGPANVDWVKISPWPPVQGETLTVYIRGRSEITFSLSFAGRPYPVHAADGAGWALVPVPPLQKVGNMPLTISAGDERLAINVPIVAGTFETINIPAATAAPILSQAAKVNAETARMTKLFAGVTPGGWTPRSLFTSPLRGKFAHTSPYGSRRTYGTNPALSAHAGEDFSAPAGTPVYAPADGSVVLAEKLFVRGNAVVLDHGNGVFTGYWHMTELNVKPGDVVKTGQMLGKVGTTGLSTGAHLHWEMQVEGMAVDPLQWAVGSN